MGQKYEQWRWNVMCSAVQFVDDSSAIKQGNFVWKEADPVSAPGHFYGCQSFAWGQKFKDFMSRVGWVGDDLACMLLGPDGLIKGGIEQLMIFLAEQMMCCSFWMSCLFAALY